MAFREVDMWEVLQILSRLGRGESNSSIKRATGADRKTIRNYAAIAAELGWTPDLGIEPDEALAGRVYARVRPGPDAGRETTIERVLASVGPQLAQWLKDEPQDPALQLTKVHQLLGRQGIDVTYSSLRRHAMKHYGYHDRRRVTVRMADCDPGEVAQLDFGQLGRIFDPITGKNRVLHALVVTLVYSRHQYVHVTHSQKLEDVIEGLDDAWRYFGGIPRRLIVDNMKTAVAKADRYLPTFNRIFEEYARHCGFVVDAAVARHPTGKPHVERNIQYVRGNFFKGEDWSRADRDQIQQRAIIWCTETAGMRTHGTTGKKPLAVFRKTEQPALLAVPVERFDVPQWGDHKVHPDHHVSFLKALYSVPTKYIGQKVTVRGDRRLVRIYHDGQLIKTHPRKRPYGRSTDYDDYPAEKTAYALRDPKRLIWAAENHGQHVGKFMGELLSGDFPWAHLRQGQALLRLADKYGDLACEQACRRALAFDLINVKRVEKIITKDLASAPLPTDGKPAKVIQIPLRFERDPGSFAHNTPNENGDSHGGNQTVAGHGPQTTAPVGDAADPAGPSGLRPQSPTQRTGVPGTDTAG